MERFIKNMLTNANGLDNLLIHLINKRYFNKGYIIFSGNRYTIKNNSALLFKLGN